MQYLTSEQVGLGFQLLVIDSTAHHPTGNARTLLEGYCFLLLPPQFLQSVRALVFWPHEGVMDAPVLRLHAGPGRLR